MMISAEKVARTVEKISTMEMDEMQAIGDRMQIEQPIVMGYLLAITQREEFTDEESQIFFFIGVVIWQLMRENPNGKRKITERDLDRAEDANEALLEKAGLDSEGDFLSVAETVLLDFPEPEVFRYMVESIMEDEEGNSENPPFGEEHVGLAFLHLKVVLDAFIAGQKKGKKE